MNMSIEERKAIIKGIWEMMCRRVMGLVCVDDSKPELTIRIETPFIKYQAFINEADLVRVSRGEISVRKVVGNLCEDYRDFLNNYFFKEEI